MLDAHNTAFAAMRRANAAIGDANVAFTLMVQAHDEAIQAAMAANQEAIAVLRAYEEGPPA
jgi:methylmalonyl-CoA mutase cobalamin-binding subunit